jgi:hypothetical protein
MRVDPDKSRYHEAADARDEFNRQELKRARLLLRRLRFLEAQIEATGGLANGGSNGGAAFAEWEVEALEWVLGADGIGFLETTGERK